MEEIDAHLHRDINHEDKEAEQLQALREAAGRIPGGKAVPHVRRDGQRGRLLHKSQSQDDSNGEAQNPVWIQMKFKNKTDKMIKKKWV